MIYGEELANIDVKRGLWLDSDLDGIPQGYAANLVNLIPDKNGTFKSRPNFLPLNSTVTATQVQTGYNTGRVATGNGRVPPYDQFYTAKAFSLDLSAHAPFNPSVLIQTAQQNPAGTITYQYSWAALNGTSNTWSSTAIPQGMLLSVCAYRDRVYGIEGGLTGSIRVYRYAFALNTVTRTLVFDAFSSAVSSLVTFRDRLFASGNKTGANSNRVYYTELAATGGYPENWNLGNNFFDLPDSGAVIWNMFVHNDRLYLFTNLGVYALYASGVPAGWRVELLTRDVRVFEEDNVNLINGDFVFTDTRNVYLYNGGSSVVAIGDPVKYAFSSRIYDFDIPISGSVQNFNGPSGFRILPFLDGFILCLSYYAIGTGFFAQTRTSKYYYYSDQNIWSEIRFDTDLDGSNRDHWSLLTAGKSKMLKVASGEVDKYSDFIVEMRLNSATNAWIAVLKAVRFDNQDVGATNFQHDIALFTAENVIGPTFTVARVKELRARFYSTLTNITFSPYCDGVFSNSYVPTHTGPGGQYTYRIPVNRQRANRLAVAMKTTFNRAAGTGANQAVYPYPSFRWDGSLYVVGNTDTRNEPKQESL